MVFVWKGWSYVGNVKVKLIIKALKQFKNNVIEFERMPDTMIMIMKNW